MNKIHLFFTFIFCVTLNSISFTQTSEEQIISMYDFQPAKLAAKDLELKMKKINQLWVEMNADTLNFLPVIRKNMMKDGASSYFYYDMASYLEIHSSSIQDKKTIEKALSKIKWEDIASWELIEKLRAFAENNISIVGMVNQLLKMEKFKLIQPETKEVFNQGKLISYLLLTSKKEQYMIDLIQLFSSFSDEAKRSVITLLWLTNTNVADDFLKTIYSPSSPYSIETRAYSQRLMEGSVLSENELNEYGSMDKTALKQLMTTCYQSALSNWTIQSWDQLILVTKINHHYSIKND